MRRDHEKKTGSDDNSSNHSYRHNRSLFNDFFQRTLQFSVVPIGAGLIITGFLLVIAERTGHSNRGIKADELQERLFVGAIQGIAIWPGISRSGSTLFGSLLCNLDRKFAVKFVFLISIPSILGSAVLEAPAAIQSGIQMADLGPIIAGMAVAAISGLIAIKSYDQDSFQTRSSATFSYYVWLLGAGGRRIRTFRRMMITAEKISFDLKRKDFTMAEKKREPGRPPGSKNKSSRTKSSARTGSKAREGAGNSV